MGAVPKYRKRSDGYAFVEHKSIPTKTYRMVLGKYGSAGSRVKYQRFLAQINETRTLSVTPGRWPTVDQIVEAYLAYAGKHYLRPYGLSTEYGCMEHALVAMEEHGRLPADEFAPRHLVEIRTRLAAEGYKRTTVNHMLSRIKKFFRWASENELCPSDLYYRLLSVRGLVKGQDGCAEAAPIQPAEAASIGGLLSCVSPVIATMVQVQYRCGMRPDEVCRMRADCIDRSEEVWFYEPEYHKTDWRGCVSIKAIPPSVQPLLAPYLACVPYMFQPGRKRQRYTSETYRRAVQYGFRKATKAGLELVPFNPNQLRHAIASHVAHKLGHRAAQVWIGHEQPSTTAMYIKTHMAELASVAMQLDAQVDGVPLTTDAPVKK